MRLEATEPLPAGAVGVIALKYGHISLEVPVCIMHTAGIQDGLRFEFESERQRAAVAELVGILGNGPSGQGLSRVK